MDAHHRFAAVAIVAAASIFSVACVGDRALRQQVDSEKQNLQQAERQLQQSQQTVKDDLAHSPDLFKDTKVSTEWPARLQSAQDSLNRAKDDFAQISKTGDNLRVKRLLTEERVLREKAQNDAESVAADANSWLDFQRNLPHYLATMQHEYDTIEAVDLTPVAATVSKAEQDWPAKKGDLDSRLAALKQSQADADAQWKATAAARQDATAGTAKGAEVAPLIEANDQLQHEADKLPHDADNLKAASGQLYDSWDKVLADLDVSQHGSEKDYREKINTVRTHYTNVADKKTEVLSDSQWVDVPAATYHSVENDLGMTIAHKDAGLFDSEANNEVQPPGFAYIAPPDVGRNQYGYWSNTGGHSVWTWLPEYLIMRQLLWGPRYQPIYINEYNGYLTARRSGQVYYGRETPASPPKYGSHGTFTQQRYASSRYVQSGGFSGSGYSSNRSAGTARPSQPGFGGFGEPENGAGKRFGGSSSGQKFGSPSGQRFGTPRAAPPRLPGRSFGRRR